MPAAVYVLCTVTSAFCAVLLGREYRRTRTRLLLWSALAFSTWAVNNLLVFTDLIVLPQVDLSLARAASAVVAVGLQLFGLVWADA